MHRLWVPIVGLEVGHQCVKVLPRPGAISIELVQELKHRHVGASGEGPDLSNGFFQSAVARSIAVAVAVILLLDASSLGSKVLVVSLVLSP